MNKIVRNTLKIIFNLSCVAFMFLGVRYFFNNVIFRETPKKIFFYQEVTNPTDVLLTSASSVLAELEIDSSKNYSLFRNKILWHYIKPDFKNYTLDDNLSLWSASFDLNDDNKADIIGLVDSHLCGKKLKCFYILQKDGDSYKDNAYFSYNGNFDRIKVLNSKTNGFYDLYLINTKDSESYSILKYLPFEQ